MIRVIIVDDDIEAARALKRNIDGKEGIVVTGLFNSGIEAIDSCLKIKPDIVLLDIKMPGMDGIEVLQKIEELKPDTPVVMISGHGNIDTAVESIKKGAYDFIEKPLDLNRLLITLRNAMDKSNLITETKVLRKKVGKQFDIIGNSNPIQKVIDMVDRVAPTDARVLITGSNGTGKELVARRLHEKSNRANGPFIEVNCAAIPSELIESELFGHEKGAFTSAIKQRKGKFEQATGGTIFLDEIGDMSLSAQAKVLRALQENMITRVGGDAQIKVDVRVVAATNKNLSHEIENNAFREDLYHRLSVILIHVPDLNDRVDDIPLLCEYFIDLICTEYGVPQKTIEEDAITELQQIRWTGNIREFRNVIERLIILCDRIITKDDVLTYATTRK